MKMYGMAKKQGKFLFPSFFLSFFLPPSFLLSFSLPSSFFLLSFSLSLPFLLSVAVMVIFYLLVNVMFPWAGLVAEQPRFSDVSGELSLHPLPGAAKGERWYKTLGKDGEAGDREPISER